MVSNVTDGFLAFSCLHISVLIFLSVSVLAFDAHEKQTPSVRKLGSSSVDDRSSVVEDLL